jgi:hypothetical protein
VRIERNGPAIQKESAVQKCYEKEADSSETNKCSLVLEAIRISKTRQKFQACVVQLTESWGLLAAADPMTAIRASAESFMMLNVMPSSFESED